MPLISKARLDRWVRHEWHKLGRVVFGPVLRVVARWTWLRHIPPWPLRAPLRPPWAEEAWETPQSLKTVPGIWRDRQAEHRAFLERPVYYFWTLYPEFWKLFSESGWSWILPSLPRRLRMQAQLKDVIASKRQQSAAGRPDIDPHILTDEIKAEAKRLGLSQIGFAPFDQKYVFGRRATDNPSPELSEGSVIVCILEQDWRLTQTIPSAKCERGVQRTYSELVERAASLAKFIQANGFQAEVQGPGGHLVIIHYAVEAGLGQLGLNGQLLTPEAGSRCRLTAITTNASLVHDRPVDFGIHAICDQCLICVKRCPPSAIPGKRSDHRGITKAKIHPARCLPVTAQAHGCAICMKVCPVQRYGLKAVTTYLVETGKILGKGSDELEGYDWIDGHHYGPESKPRIDKEFMTPMDMTPLRAATSRKDPPASASNAPPPGTIGAKW